MEYGMRMFLIALALGMLLIAFFLSGLATLFCLGAGGLFVYALTADKKKKDAPEV